MTIEITNPIEHDHVIYTRGVRELPDDLAKLFLTYKHAARLAPEPATTTAAAPGPLPAARAGKKTK